MAGETAPRSVGFLRTAAEISAPVLPTNYSYQTQPYDMRRYGQLANNVADDTASVNSGLLVAQETVNGAAGNAVAFNQNGVSPLSSMIMLPNRGAVLGLSSRGSYFQASPGWTTGNGAVAWSASTSYVASNSFQGCSLVIQAGTPYICKVSNTNQSPPNSTYWNPISNAMFYAHNGYLAGIGQSMFNSTLERIAIDCNNVAGLGGVLSSAWQDNCGIRSGLITNFSTYGIKFQDGFGGADLCRIQDCEIFSGTTAGTTGIDLSTPMGTSGAFTLDLFDTVIAGGANLAFCININGNSMVARTLHVEACAVGVQVDGNGYVSLEDMDGASTVTTLVQIAYSFTGTLVMKNCRRNGSTNFIVDNRVNQIVQVGTITPGSLYTNGTYGLNSGGGTGSGANPGVAVTGGSGTNAAAVVTVAGGVVTSFSLVNQSQKLCGRRCALGRCGEHWGHRFWLLDPSV